MDRYGPKHVELTPEHQQTISAATLCISLECIYIAKNDTPIFQYRINFIAELPPKYIGHSCSHLQSSDNKNTNIIKMYLYHITA